MNTKTDKANEVETVEISPMNVIARQFGIKDEIGDSINTFLNEVISPTIEATDCASILGAADVTVAKQLACEEVKDKFDTSDVEAVAASYVVERVFGQTCRDLHFGLKFGNEGIAKAQKQVATQLIGLRTAKGDEVKERTALGRISWLTQLKCQQSFRISMFLNAQVAYRAQTGKVWVEPNATEDTPDLDVSADPALAILMG